MTKKQVIDIIRKSGVCQKEHFLNYHFDLYNCKREHPLAKSIVEAIVDLEKIIPTAGLHYITRIASIHDAHDQTQQFDQLLQILAELMVVHKAATFQWAGKAIYTYTRTTGPFLKTPKLTIITQYWTLGLAVNAPEFLTKQHSRATKSQQNSSENYSVKEFLISADEKFARLKKEAPRFYGILVIVWDDFIGEPISALTNRQTGLFTENSFAKDTHGAILRYPNVDCVIVTKHLPSIVLGTKDVPPPDFARHPLDYGMGHVYPFKVLVPNPWNKTDIPEEMVSCFQALPWGLELGPEYASSDYYQTRTTSDSE